MRLVSIGDSFTEGVGDELPDGFPRGWADLLASGLARDRGAPVEYANLAVRGRLAGQIVAEQLEPALALEPTALTFNGGGNDLLRPRADIGRLRALTEHVILRCLESGVQPIVLSGGDPTRGLPLGRRMRQLGDRLTSEVVALTAKYEVPFTNNWADAELARADYWAEDRLHLNSAGHQRVAARVLQTLGASYPDEWMAPAAGRRTAPTVAENLRYYRRYVLPWVRRRLTGRSSGDDRTGKYPDWIVVEPGLPAA
ncbi:SGNH/GDSL hydrolase family protein [Jiangella rhizosphaerae]|uniref:SGNH/GDSL hydrolase family protein n=1 Tax=Jiangella rhizosphaerae TaxID=2293569 RepID=A0A418KTB2_9ACTN|nr:SGNH/GDSL hydrolase family protein [Jiangella rhizosphaerae]RIQ29640.1 SGNH/GDSL hydrolase family protein [Jiangella rhizosphaerae]